MGTFLRGKYPVDYEMGFVQGAARILIAPISAAYPVGLEDIIDLDATGGGATLYDPLDPWVDVGFTKTGINITRNNAEETFTVDQIRSAIKTRPSNWEMSVGTQLAEASLDTFALAWELDDPTTVVKTTPQLDESHVGLGSPTSYPERRMCVLFQFPPVVSGGTVAAPGSAEPIRAWVFRRCLHAAQESGFTLQNTGEQVSLPWRLNCMADGSVPVGEQFGEIFEQIPDTPGP
jgi:hypothetical protein